MISSIYIESSIVSYLTARLSRDIVTASRQTLTLDWWQNIRPLFEVYISPLVVEEISGGDKVASMRRLEIVADIPSLAVSVEAELLAKQLLVTKVVPSNSARDALHIAIAATQGMDYLLTWNFKHINNAATRMLISKVILDRGYECPVLCSPEELGDPRNGK